MMCRLVEFREFSQAYFFFFFFFLPCLLQEQLHETVKLQEVLQIKITYVIDICRLTIIGMPPHARVVFSLCKLGQI